MDCWYWAVQYEVHGDPLSANLSPFFIRFEQKAIIPVTTSDNTRSSIKRLDDSAIHGRALYHLVSVIVLNCGRRIDEQIGPFLACVPTAVAKMAGVPTAVQKWLAFIPLLQKCLAPNSRRRGLWLSVVDRQLTPQSCMSSPVTGISRDLESTTRYGSSASGEPHVIILFCL